MKAVIIATNQSAQLAPLTNNLPGPLLPLAGKPIMAYSIELLARAGISDIVICVQRMGGNIEAWFGSGRRFGVNVQFSPQRDDLGDGGALKWASRLIDGPFLLIPGDALQDLRIEQLMHTHSESGCDTTIVTSKQAEAAADEDGLSEMIGSYIFQPAVLDLIPAREYFDIQTDLIPLLQQSGTPIHYFSHSGVWNRMQTFQDLKTAQVDYLKSAVGSGCAERSTFQFPTIPGNRFGENVWAGKNNIIHPSVRIYPPVVIGDNCQIGRDVELGPFTTIGSNAIIDDEATVQQSIVTEKTYIGKLVDVKEKIVARNLMIDYATAESAYVTDSFLIGEITRPIINNGVRLFSDKLLAFLFILVLSPLFVLVGLCTLLGTGKLFKTVQRIGVAPSNISYGNPISPGRIQLTRFNTRKPNGSAGLLTGWIEKSAMHRLPELFNVLIGRLSLVGVKPLSTEEASQLDEEWQYQRYSFSAGVTGLWYTENGDLNREEVTLINDVYYVAMRSFREDLRILLKTPAKWAKTHLFS